MAPATKFQFDAVFDIDAPEPEPRIEEQLPPPPAFSEEELAQAAAEAFARGRAEALAEAEAADARRAAKALEQLGASFAALGPDHAAGWERCRGDALTLAAAIVRKVVPKTMQKAASEAVETVVVSTLPQLVDEPRVVIRLAGEQLEILRGRIEDAARDCGYPGQVILLAEEGLAGPDCRIEWSDGGAEFETGRMWREIEQLIDRHLNGVREHEAAQAKSEELQEESTDG